MIRTCIVLAVLAAACSPSDPVDRPDPDGGENADGEPLGPSGLASDLPLEELSSADQRQLCGWLTTFLGGEGHVVHCGETGDVVVATVQECIDQITRFAVCELRVLEVEACSLELAAMPCEVMNGGACERLSQCPP
jgi:hypothetical protein